MNIQDNLNDTRVLSIRLNKDELKRIKRIIGDVTSTSIKDALFSPRQATWDDIFEWVVDNIYYPQEPAENEVKEFINFMKDMVRFNVLQNLPGQSAADKVRNLIISQGNIKGGNANNTNQKTNHQFAGYTFVGHFPDEQNASGMLAVVRNKFGLESTFESGSPEYQSLVNADYEPFFKVGEVIQ